MINTETSWIEYLKSEIPKISNILSQHKITPQEDQPHIKGERFLMQALTTKGGQKIILLGIETKTQKSVVIKAANDRAGRQELRHERECRTALKNVNFSYETFHEPPEILFLENDDYTIFVTEFIEQSSSFLNRSLEEQFLFALKALKAQERTRATTAGHLAQIQKVFGSRNSEDYLVMFEIFCSTYQSKFNNQNIIPILAEALETINKNKDRIEQYGNFLTHTDFVPHNFRIAGETLYLLDFSSLRFGNKHEGWARFLNFMTLYNPDLETLLLSYMKNNRSKEELESLHLMRLFRLGEIIAYYCNTLDKSSGNLLTLNHIRVGFWSEVLKAELQNTKVAREIVETYKATRDQLRSESEKERQVELH